MPNLMSFRVAEAGLDGPALRVGVDDLAGLWRWRRLIGQAPGLLHVLGFHAHDGADGMLGCCQGGPGQLDGTAALADPVRGRAALPRGRRDVRVAPEPDHIVEAERPEIAEQLWCRRNPDPPGSSP